MKEYIAKIVGEPYLDTDWRRTERRTHLADRIDGQRAGRFLLKGLVEAQAQARQPGKNGDQIRRLSKQEADLYVVQHVGEFDEAVRDHLEDMCWPGVQRESKCRRQPLDGSDCARLFVAHGLIDPNTGQPLP